MPRTRFRWLVLLAVLAPVAACGRGFQLKKYTTNEALYDASLRQFNRHKWTDAIAGFEKLTLELSPRDSLLPRSYWYLGKAHQNNGDHLLASEAFNRIFESFPNDTLAERAGLETARSYWKLWRKTYLTPEYGETALGTYTTLIQLYPDSKLVDTAKKEALELQDWFARKDYDTGMFYVKDGLYDSGMIYFRTILAKYPETPTARRAALRMVEAFRAIKYLEDAAELCTEMRERFKGDADVDRMCPAAAGKVVPPTKPDTTRSVAAVAR